MRDYKAYVEAILNKKKPAISRASLHEEAMELLAARRKIHDHEAIRDFTRLTLIASDMLTTVDAERRDALLKELAKSIRLGDQPVAAKDLQKSYFGQDGTMQKKSDELLGPIREKIQKAINEVAAEGDFMIIFDVSALKGVVYTNAESDLSSVVINKLNAR